MDAFSLCQMFFGTPPKEKMRNRLIEKLKNESSSLVT